jgi:TRAP-type C4-dicarboxylate transport system substrate-binding protein
MKKTTWAIAILVVALVLGLGSLLAACGGEETTTTTAPPATTATTVAPATTTTTAAPTTTTEAGVPDTGQTYKLKMAFHVPSRASIVGAYYQPWADAVAEATKGRVTIEMYAEETLVKEADQVDAVKSGLADLASTSSDATPGRFPLADFYGLPELFPSAEVASRVYWDILNEFCADEYKDFVILGTPTIAAAQYFGNKAAKVPADMAGQRVRSGGEIEAWLIEALGATPVEISTGELATSMERGMADSCFLSWSFGLITGVKDTTKFRTETNMFYRCFAIIMNKDVWNSMPKTLQDAIMSVSGGEASGKYSAANEALAAEDKGAIEGAGKGAGLDPIYVPTAAELTLWKDAAKPVWAKWVQNVGGNAQALVDKALVLIDKYAAMPPTEVTTTTAPAGTTGIFFKDLGGGKVHLTIVPDPGKEFDVGTEGPFGAKVEAFDATGKSLGALDIPESAKGVLDYSAVKGIAKIVATDAAHGGATYEYLIP